MLASQVPLGVIGNLRFTRAGVYAEYLMSGLPFIFLSQHWQDTVAAEHAELLPERETLFLNTYINVHQHAFAVAAFGHTNVAVASNVVGIARPSALAVVRLITSSNLVG